MSLASWHRKNAAGLIGPKPIRMGRGCVRWSRAELIAWTEASCPDRLTWQALKGLKDNKKGK
jgi:predicted DNA-binding transcriptional regulator AlpA